MEEYLFPILVLVGYINIYKIPLMLFEEHYWIFNNPAMGESNSPRLWLVVHTIWALVHLSVIAIKGFDKNPWVRTSHYLFCSMILVNFWNFGHNVWYIASFFNLLPLVIMAYGFERSRWIYLFGFLSAPITEIVFKVIAN